MATTSNITSAGAPDPPHVYYVVLGVLGSLGFLFNAVLLFVLWRNKTPEFRLGTSYVIGNLALADSLTGIAVLFLSVARIRNFQSILKFQVPMVWTTIEASLMSLMFLSVERTLAFRFPFASKSFFTVQRTVIAILFIWLLAFTCGLFVYFYTVETQLAMTVIFELCVVMFLFSQGYIITKMEKRKRRNLFCDRDVSMVTRKHLHGQEMNNHVTKVVSVLIVIVVVTLLPYMVALQVLFLSRLKLGAPLSEKTSKTLIDFIYYFYPIELLNFVVNPIVYAYRLKRYRQGFYYAFSFFNCGPFKKRKRFSSRASNECEMERKQASVKKNNGVYLSPNGTKTSNIKRLLTS